LNLDRVASIALLLLFATRYRCAAQEPAPATQPTTRAVATTQENLSDLVNLVEDPKNPPEARRRAARLLLMQPWPETPPRLAAILTGQNVGAKVAVATALTELPQFLDAAYVDPLLGLLADTDGDVRAAGARALAGYRDGGVAPRLRRQALDPDLPQRTRLGAIAALGLMTQRAAIDGLAESLGDRDALIAAAALTAFQQATALDFKDDPAEAQKWWETTRSLTDEDWQRLQIERLVQRDREMRARLDAVEARLAKVLESNFQRAPDAERGALLTEYLSDNSTTIRLLGLKLTQHHLDEGRSPDTLPSELVARIRDLMNSNEPREQAAAVQTVARFRNPQDAEQFVTMLSTARNRAVRLALVNGLGYVGNGAAAEALLGVLETTDPELATEAVAALGRLAERGELRGEPRARAVPALARVFGEAPPTQVALRERVLWAMGNVADPSFGPAFAAALDRSEAVAVRMVAVRGIAGLGDPKLADALIPAVSDPDATVRKAAIETLTTLGSGDRHLQALWTRLASPPETDEAVRQAAWRGALTLLEKRSPAEIEEWITRLPGEGRTHAQRTLDLLQRLLKSAETSNPPDVARVTSLHARIAAQYAQLDQPSDALSEYGKALDAAHGEQETTQRIALDMLRYALVSERYDSAAARILATVTPALSPTALWTAVKAEIEMRLTPDAVERAVGMLAAVEQYPPCEWPPDVAQELSQLRERIGKLREAASKPAAESRPTSAPTTRRNGKPPQDKE